MLNAGDILQDRYEIINCIGSGGMADVYKAKDRKLNRFVAIKVMRPEFRGDSEFVSKFRIEAQAAAGLSHANIVKVYDVGDDSGLAFIVMELVEGITLKEYIRSKGRLSVRETTGIALQVAAGLEAAHSGGIIHRDIKPQNIIMSTDGSAKVADFGIARAASSDTIHSTVMGSVHYSAPEQARGGYSDARSDIYSLGITMYEMLTGQVPFDGDSTVEVALKHLQQDIVSPRQFVPDLPRAIEQIILKCTQKSPDRRYQNMSELIYDLKESLVDPNGTFVRIGPENAGAGTQEYTREQIEEINRRLLESGGTEEGGQSSLSQITGEGREQTGPASDGGPADSGTPQPYRGLFSGSYDDRMDYPPKDEDIEEDYDPEDDPDVAYDDPDGPPYRDAGSLQGSGSGPERSFSEGRGGTARRRKKRTSGTGHERAALGLSVTAVIIVGVIILYLLSHTFGLLTGGSGGSGQSDETAISISLTSDVTAVPDIRGLSESEAQAALKEHNLDYSYQGEESSSDYAAGLVMSQDPDPGTKVKEGSTIGYRLSTGSGESLTIPDLTDKSQQDAEDALKAMGLFISVDNTRFSDTVEEGRVITTNPGAGSSVREGDTVTLYISQGKDSTSITMPDVTGHYRDDAVKKLQYYGLYVFVTTEYSDTVDKGLVISQDVPAGSSVQTGSSVTLTVSDGPEPAAGTGDEPDTAAVTILPDASSGTASADASSGTSASSGTWRCYASLSAPAGYSGETVRITLEQNGTESLVYEGRTSFPYILNVEGIPGVSEGSAYVYVLDDDGSVKGRVHYTGIEFSESDG